MLGGALPLLDLTRNLQCVDNKCRYNVTVKKKGEVAKDIYFVQKT